MTKRIFKGLVLILLIIISLNINLKANAQTTKEEVEKIEVTYDYIPKDGSDEHNLMWGSSMGIYAKVILSDGTAADIDNNEIYWEIKEKNGRTVQSVQTEYVTSDGFKGLEIYAPYGYTEELIIKAVYKNNSDISASYQLNTTSTSPIFGDKFNAGKTFFRFKPNEPTDEKAVGDEPLFTEKWDKENTSYSVILPDNTYQIDGYEFKGWKDEYGKLHQPGETLTIKSTGSPAFYTLDASWKKSGKTEIVTTQSATTEKPTISEQPQQTSSAALSATLNETETKTEQSPKTGDTGFQFIIYFIMIISGMLVMGQAFKAN